MFSGFLEVLSTGCDVGAGGTFFVCKKSHLECLRTISVLAPSSHVSFPSEFIYTFSRSVYFNFFFSSHARRSVS